MLNHSKDVYTQKYQMMGIIFSSGETASALVNYRALYPFEARNHDEMSFNSGDVIQVRNEAFPTHE